MIGRIASELTSTRVSDRVVPTNNRTARLTLVASAAMAFLAVLALSAALAAAILGAGWKATLETSTTIRLMGEGEELERAIAVTLDILATVPGARNAEHLDMAAQADLLAPWLGAAFPETALPPARMITLKDEMTEANRAALVARLAAEVPGATFENHGAWRDPLIETAVSVRNLGGVAVALSLLAQSVLVMLAASAALAANRGVIETLRLIGATHGYIRKAFVRRITLRVGLGALIGTMAGAALLLILPEGSVALAPTGWGWAILPTIPFVAMIASFAATRATANHMLTELT